MSQTTFDFNAIKSANPDLDVTIDPDSDNMESMFGITDQRNHELISALNMLLEANNLTTKDLTIQTAYIASLKLAKTPNELAWLSARTTVLIAGNSSGFRNSTIKTHGGR